jgi:hypothetical protein
LSPERKIRHFRLKGSFGQNTSSREDAQSKLRRAATLPFAAYDVWLGVITFVTTTYKMDGLHVLQLVAGQIR